MSIFTAAQARMVKELTDAGLRATADPGLATPSGGPCVLVGIPNEVRPHINLAGTTYQCKWYAWLIGSQQMVGARVVELLDLLPTVLDALDADEECFARPTALEVAGINYPAYEVVFENLEGAI